MKELFIDILNYLEYELNIVEFKSNIDNINFDFDCILLKWVFSNFIVNVFIYGDKNIKVCVYIILNERIEIIIFDNGKGMLREEVLNLFNCYYRGSNIK